MALGKLVDALNSLKSMYVDELGKSLAGGSTSSGRGQGQGHTASGKLGNSLKANKQAKVKVFGHIYKMQITMEDYGDTLDKGRGATKGGGTGELKESIFEWLKQPNVLARLKGADKQLSDYERRGLAYVIARKIHRDGYEGKHWIKPALDTVQPRIVPMIEAAIVDGMELTFEDIKKLIEG